MTTVATNRPALKSPFSLSRLIWIFNDWNDARITRNSLSKLSPHELADIGLVPGDIDRIARNG